MRKRIVTLEDIAPSYADAELAESATHDDDCECDLCTMLYECFGPGAGDE